MPPTETMHFWDTMPFSYRTLPAAVKSAIVNVPAGTTDQALVTAVPGLRIVVLQFRIHAGGTATSVTFNSKPSGAGVAISEAFQCGANGGRADGFSPVGHFHSATGEGLTVTTGAGSTVGIGVRYIEVEP